MLDELLKTMVENNFLPDDAVLQIKKLFPVHAHKRFRGLVTLTGGYNSPDLDVYVGPIRPTRHEAARDALRAWLDRVCDCDPDFTGLRTTLQFVKVLQQVQSFLQRKKSLFKHQQAVFDSIRAVGSICDHYFPRLEELPLTEPHYTEEKADRDLAACRETLVETVRELLGPNPLVAALPDDPADITWQGLVDVLQAATANPE